MLYNCDFLSIKPMILVNQRRRVHTLTGALLSLLAIILSLTVFFLLFAPFVNKKNLNVVYSTYYEKYKNINLGPNNYPIALSIWDSLGNVIPENEKVYNVKALMVYNIFKNINETNVLSVENKFLDMKKCDKSSFGDNFQLFNNSRWNNMYCLDYDKLDVQNLNLTNPKSNGYNFTQLRFVFTKCVNSTENNNTCHSSEVIEKYLSSYMIHIETMDYYIDNNSVETPLVPVKLSQIFLSNLQTYQLVQYDLKNIIYNDDKGIIFDLFTTKNYTSLHSSQKTSGFESATYFSGGFANFDLNLNNRGLNDKFTRNYPKLQSIVADTGGFIKLILIVFQLIAFLLTRIEYNNYLISEMFDQLKDNNKLNMEEVPKINNYDNFQQINNSQILHLKTKKYPTVINKTKNSKLRTDSSSKIGKFTEYKFKHSFKNIFLYICNGKNQGKSKILLDKCLRSLDIKNLIKITYQLNYLKMHCQMSNVNNNLPVENLNNDIMVCIDKNERRIKGNNENSNLNLI